jgi:hypothetical protein
MSTGAFGGDSWSVLFSTLKGLRTSWPSRGWSWDSRFSCVTSTFNVELLAKARTAVASSLATEWTPASIARAPAPLKDLAERTGGLREGQMILVSSTVGSAYAYGLWWPWGDAITTSLRIGLGGTHVPHDAFQRLRDTFGVEA